MHNNTYFIYIALFSTLVACSEAPVDTSALISQSNQPQNSNNQGQDSQSPGNQVPISTYSAYRPVMHDIVGDSQSSCSQSASALVGYSVQCTLGGGCSGGSAYGYCGLGPVRQDKIQDAAFVDAAYSSADSNYPAVKKSAALLHQLYVKVLGREPDLPGYYYWLNDFFNIKGTGTTNRSLTYLTDAVLRVPAHTAYSQSNYAQFLTNIYQGLFNRAPDQAGYNYYLAQLNNHTITMDEVLGSFYLSSEFATLKADIGL